MNLIYRPILIYLYIVIIFILIKRLNINVIFDKFNVYKLSRNKYDYIIL